MESEDKDELAHLLENYPLNMLLLEMATIILDRIENAKVPVDLEKAGLSPKPHAVLQRSKRMRQAMQLQALAHII